MSHILEQIIMWDIMWYVQWDHKLIWTSLSKILEANRQRDNDKKRKAFRNQKQGMSFRTTNLSVDKLVFFPNPESFSRL